MKSKLIHNKTEVFKKLPYNKRPVLGGDVFFREDIVKDADYYGLSDDDIHNIIKDTADNLYSTAIQDQFQVIIRDNNRWAIYAIANELLSKDHQNQADLCKSCENRVAIPSSYIYTSLRSLVWLGLIDHFSSGRYNKVEIKKSPHGHVICSNCETIISEFPIDFALSALKSSAKSTLSSQKSPLNCPNLSFQSFCEACIKTPQINTIHLRKYFSRKHVHLLRRLYTP